ncbi:leucine-rich repeat extensin-like protein 3, partial [Asbolus verrucosus]
NTPEVPIVPVKTSLTIPCGDDTLHQQPPGLPHVPPLQPQEFVAWSIPGFPCGAPEVPPPFPLPTVSPLVSESTSPNHSRSTSPHRTIVTLRSTPMPPPQPPRPIDTMPTQLPLDALSSNNFPFLQSAENVKMPDDELNSIPEEKLMLEGSWGPVPLKELKQPNGIRFGVCPAKGNPRPFVLEQFQALSMDGDNSLQRSNSSSGSSPNQTPPETPAATPHSQKRVNGMPSFVGMPLCDATSPPPTFNSCSVPYTTYPTFAAIPNRSMFPYTQSYRPPFTPFPSYQANDSSFPTYSVPYMSIIYSSQFPPRSPNCHNCGALGHAGQDCTGQNIEDITQKKTYTIEFSAPLPDGDK